MGKGGNVQSEIALWITPDNPEDVEKTMESIESHSFPFYFKIVNFRVINCSE